MIDPGDSETYEMPDSEVEEQREESDEESFPRDLT